MASAPVGDNFTEQLKEIRKKIRDSFKRSHEVLQVRENDLLSRVEEIETEFGKKVQEMDKLSEAMNTVTTVTSDTFSDKKFADVRENFHSKTNSKIAELLNQVIEFEWDPQFEANIEQLGSIKLNHQANTSPHPFPPQVKPVIPDYKTKNLPAIYFCRKYTDKVAPGELNCPNGLAIHYETGHVYIADCNNNRVQVFNGNGVYLSMFGEKMNRPAGICISLNQVIVTQYRGNCINVYELGGKLVKSVASGKIEEEQLKCPQGIAVSARNNYIYVCEHSNNRVQIFTQDLEFHCIMGIGMLWRPRDVRVTRDNVLVLDESDPCLSVFSSDHVLTNRLITHGDNKQTKGPYCFDIDREYNIIMSDYSNHCVYVFTKEGEQTHKFGKEGQGLGEFYRPFGIALDNTGRIFVVCRKDTACLQIF